MAKLSKWLGDHRLLVATLCLAAALVLLACSGLVGVPNIITTSWQLVVFGVITLFAGSAILRGVSDDKDRFVSIVTEVFLGLVFGALYVWLQAKRRIGSDANAAANGQAPAADVPVDWTLAAVVTLLVFLVQVSSKFVRTAESQAEQTKAQLEAVKEQKGLAKVQESQLERMTSVVGRLDFAEVALRAVGVRHQWVDVWSRYATPAKPGTAGAMLGATDGVVVSGRAWLESFPEEQLQDARFGALWLSLVETYHREEAYDVARREIVTNVRNYVYLLLAAIRQMHKALEPGQRLVVLNCSPFSPKDYYNYPNGPKGDRAYFELEFFGAYRRLFRSLSKDSWAVDCFRFLPFKEGGSASSKAWEPDTRDMLRAYSWGHYVIPVPVEVRFEPARTWLESEIDGRPWHSLVGAVGPNGEVREDRNPARFFKRDSGVFLYCPLFLVDANDPVLAPLRNKYMEQGDSLIDDLADPSEWLRQNKNRNRVYSVLLKHYREAEDKAWVAVETKVGRAPLASDHGARAAFDMLKALRKQGMSSAADQLDAVQYCQRLDHALVMLGDKKQIQFTGRSYGSALGAAENWLNTWLRHKEVVAEVELKAGRLKTVWDAFVGDFVGGDADRLRLVDATKFRQRGVDLDEFIMLGVVSGKKPVNDLANVEWKVQIGSEMADPFHSCRVTFKFAGDAKTQSGADEVAATGTLLEGLWHDPDSRLGSKLTKREEDWGA